MNLKILLIVFGAIVLLLGVMTLIFLNNPSSNKPAPGNPAIPVFSPSPSSSNLISNPTTPPQTSTNTGYSPEGLNQNYQRTAHTTLSPDDQATFNKITVSLSGQDDIVTQTNSFQINYDNPPNEFLVEILSNNADLGKQDAVNWLLKQGFSNAGVCSLKMVIYLSPSVKSYYQQNNLEFNPVPNGC